MWFAATVNGADYASDIGRLLQDFARSLSEGLLFFGGPLDVFLTLIDISVTTLIIYFILKLVRDSRAWQLLKGLVFILAFALITSALGLHTIGFLLNSTISLFAFAFVVLFQPELRRALETVGRSGFRVMPDLFAKDMIDMSGSIHQLIESIVTACEYFSNTMTGALILIERTTPLGDLQSQENALTLDSAVSATLLKQIFYIGSPLHDGAILIRDGRIAAARVHVPLADSYHLRRDYGTRHRAAIGASEIGDTVAVVVSEERGSISIALGGQLFELNNGDALRAQLFALLQPERLSTAKKRSGFLRFRYRDRASVAVAARERVQTMQQEKESEEPFVEEGDAFAVADEHIEDGQEGFEESIHDLPEQPRFSRTELAESGQQPFWRRSLRSVSGENHPPRKKKQRVGLFILSIFISLVLWVVVQVTVNPVATRTFSLELQYRGIEQAQESGYLVQRYPTLMVQATVRGRRQLLSDMRARDMVAYIDLSDVKVQGIQTLPVEIETGVRMFTQTSDLSPATVTVSIRPISFDETIRQDVQPDVTVAP